jgi:transposase InsO family protein
VRYAFIRDHRHEFPVEVACDVLRVSRSGYYAWDRRPTSPAAVRRGEVLDQIRRVHQESRQTYGSPRVHRALQARGIRCCVNTVAKLMKGHAIRSKASRRFVVRTTDSRHDRPVAENVLARAFYPERPDEVWTADITYVPTAEGWLYLAVVLDLFSRRVVGWATADHLRAELACDALRMALEHRRPHGELLHHSDRGVQYASDAYQGLLREFGIEPSMSRKGNCHDNAVTESFFSTTKRELTHHESDATREEARASLFEYIEVFYNRQRLHSTLGYRSPVEYEMRFASGARPSAHFSWGRSTLS